MPYSQSQPTSRVFVPKPDHRFDLTDAERFGEVVYVLHENHFPLDVQFTFGTALHYFKMHRYDPSVDFLCMTGTPLLVSPLLAALVHRYSRVQLLVFDAKEGKYEQRNIYRPGDGL